MLAQRNMPKLPTSSSVFRLFLWYLWSIPIVVAVLHIFDLHFEYDGDLMFWVIAGYIAPAGLLSEAVGQGFGVGLSIYIILLAVITAWSVRRSRRANAPSEEARSPPNSRHSFSRGSHAQLPLDRRAPHRL